MEYNIYYKTCFHCNETGSHYGQHTTKIKAESFEKACELIEEKHYKEDETCFNFYDLTYEGMSQIEILQTVI